MVYVPTRHRAHRRRPRVRLSVSSIRSILYAGSVFLLVISFITLQMQSEVVVPTRGLDEMIHLPPQHQRALSNSHEPSTPKTNNNNTSLLTGATNLTFQPENPPVVSPLNTTNEAALAKIEDAERKEIVPDVAQKSSHLADHEDMSQTKSTLHSAVKSQETSGSYASEGAAAAIGAPTKAPTAPVSGVPKTELIPDNIVGNTQQHAPTEPTDVQPPTPARPNTTLVATNAAQASVLHAFHTTIHNDTLPTAGPVQSKEQTTSPTAAPVAKVTPAEVKKSTPAPISVKRDSPTAQPLPAPTVPAKAVTTSPTAKPTTAPVVSVAPKIEQPLKEPPAPPSMFVIVADSRSASDWILSRLDSHPKVCSATESGGMGTGFPLGTMLPDGMPWLEDSDNRQGCTLRFIRDHVQILLDGATESSETKKWELPALCRDDTKIKPEDGLRFHYPRLCRFAQHILDEGLYDRSNNGDTAAAITHLYMKAYESNDGDLLACQCPEATQVRGFKTMSDWIPRIPGFLDERYQGLKVIRLHRRNVVARYMSLTAAVHTQVWQTHTAAEKERQLQLLKEKQIAVDSDDMMRQIRFMDQADQKADQWAADHVEDGVKDVLSIEYEDCRDDAVRCFSRIFEFIGITDSKDLIAKKTDEFTSSFKDSKAAELSSILEHATNKLLVETVLAGNNLGHFVGVEEMNKELLHHLHIVTTKSLPMRRVSKPSMDHIETTTVFLDSDPSKPKFSDAVEALSKLPFDADTVVSISSTDWRVDVNHHIRGQGSYYSTILEFRTTLREFTNKGAVVVSATNTCCSAALSHASPGEFLSVTEQGVTRKKQACDSGSTGCAWASDEKGGVWRKMFEDLATKNAESPDNHTVYLDGTVMAGKAKDLLQLFKELSVRYSEDETAVLADYLLQKPSSVVLDYEERLFGRQFLDGRQTKTKGCFSSDALVDGWRYPTSDSPLPLFVHTPRDRGCEVSLPSKQVSFPKWEGEGIKFDPIIQHIDELFVKKQTLYGITLHFRPEILYYVGKNGVSSTYKNPEPYRILPTEKLYKRATEILLMEANKNGKHWPSLRKTLSGAGFPFWAWFGDYKGCNLRNGWEGDSSTPLFTTCATRNCNHTFPSPQYMSILNAKDEPSEWYNTFYQYDKDYPWSSKIRKIVWRGTLSESDPSKVFSSVRWQLCQRVASQSNLADYFDVGLTQVTPGMEDKIDVTHAGGFKASIDPMDAFQRYTAVLDMDGNSWSSRFESLLCYNSVILKVEPEYLDYFHYDLRPWRHYIPIKADLSDLEEVARFVTDPSNDQILLEMVAAANHWCSEHLTMGQLAYDQLDLWEKYVSLLDQGDPTWPSQWKTKRNEMYAKKKPYDLGKLK